MTSMQTSNNASARSRCSRQSWTSALMMMSFLLRDDDDDVAAHVEYESGTRRLREKRI